MATTYHRHFVIALGFLCLVLFLVCPSDAAPTLQGENVVRQAPATAPIPQGEDYTTRLSAIKQAPPMPIHVTPWYNSEGPIVNVGKYTIGLASKDPKVVLNTISEMSRSWSELRAETMFVASIRLYDMGLKDDAFYWFQSAKHRALLFLEVVQPSESPALGDPTFELQMGFGAFSQLAGTYINGHAFGDLDKAVQIIEKVQQAESTVPNLAKAYPKIKFIDQSAWEQKNQKSLEVFTKLLDYMKKHAEEIQAERKKNGIEGKY
ncbi:MAG: hypothetical protein PVH19_10725 [Planctomycetia bacterium]